jgi:hypothetical protein
LSVVSWQLAVGSWQLAVGSWQLAERRRGGILESLRERGSEFSLRVQKILCSVLLESLLIWSLASEQTEVRTLNSVRDGELNSQH